MNPKKHSVKKGGGPNGNLKRLRLLEREIMPSRHELEVHSIQQRMASLKIIGNKSVLPLIKEFEKIVPKIGKDPAVNGRWEELRQKFLIIESRHNSH